MAKDKDTLVRSHAMVNLGCPASSVKSMVNFSTGWGSSSTGTSTLNLSYSGS